MLESRRRSVAELGLPRCIHIDMTWYRSLRPPDETSSSTISSARTATASDSKTKLSAHRADGDGKKPPSPSAGVAAAPLFNMAVGFCDSTPWGFGVEA
jgi:hypothetical protein